METPIEQPDATLITGLLSTLMEEVYKKIYDDIENQFKDIIKKIEAYEDQVATIVYAYGEQAVVMEALATQLNYASPEAQKAFTDSLSEQRKKMVETLNEGSKGFVADKDPGLARAINNVVKEKLSSTDK
jgi:methyl-accepting chemotaxis protein